MKIAFLLTQSLESPSGLGRYWPLARELSRSGHQISIYATHPAYSELEEIDTKKAGVRVRYVAPMHVQKRGNRKTYLSTPSLVLNILTATWKLSAAAAQSEAELIHVCKPHPMNGIAGLLSKRFQNKRLYLDCDDYEAASNRFGSQWQQSGLAKFEKWMPARVSLTTTNTYFMQNMLLSWGVPEEKIVYLPNGVDRDRFKSLESNMVTALRKRLGLNGTKVVAFIGTLSLPSHPVDLLLKSFVQVKQRHPKVALLVVGAGEDFGFLKNQAKILGIQDSTLFVGRIPPDEVHQYYKLADVIVDPVHDNPAAKGRSPLKMFESWASKIPFVTADVGDRKTIMGEPPAGLLAMPGNPESMSDCILRILNDPELAEELVAGGTQRVEKYYWDNLAKSIEFIYQ